MTNTEKFKKDLILDNGKIRNCPRNKAILGYVKSYWYFFSYKKVIKDFMLREVIEAFLTIFLFLFWIILFIVLPFIHCFVEVKRAKKQCITEDNLRKNKNV